MNIKAATRGLSCGVILPS